MALSEDNTRVLVTITKQQKQELEDIAQKDKRSISNLCSKILSDYLERLKEGEKK